MPKSKQIEDFRQNFQIKLLNWYKNNNRKFPWRFKKDPYDIIIAEIMLQKTNAEKVEKTYPLFLKKYPNIESIIIASDEEIKDILRYLGLQNEKVQILKNLANTIIKDHDGQIPSCKEDLLKIKGIGNYIANAILCFVFNKRVPIIDGNIIRILDRVFNIKSPKKNPRTDKDIWKKMEEIIPLNNYKQFNYALLDFASLICKFYSPKCEECFFTENCYYFKNRTYIIKKK